MDEQTDRRQTRRQQIGDRLAAIRARIDDLRQPREARVATASGELAVEAQDHADAAQAAAQQALARSIEGLLAAAKAPERCAISHERLALSPGSDKEHHRQRAAAHREAAAVDRQRAETARSLLLADRAENARSHQSG